MIRWLTGLTLLVAILAGLWVGGWLWLGLIAAFLAVAGIEWGRMGESNALMVSIVILAGFAVLRFHPGWDPLYVVAVIFGLLIIPVIPLVASQDPYRVRDWIWTASGLIWLAVPGALLIELHTEAGRVLLTVMLAATAFQDTVALYAGKWFGTPGSLAPGLSPNKSFAGGIANFLGAIFCLLIGAYWTGGDYLMFALVGAVLGVTGQLGDLLISGIKRRVQVDDTGGFLPGHGGVLDRADGLVINTVAFFLLLPLLNVPVW